MSMLIREKLLPQSREHIMAIERMRSSKKAP
jgi:hypothetical protein